MGAWLWPACGFFLVIVWPYKFLSSVKEFEDILKKAEKEHTTNTEEFKKTKWSYFIQNVFYTFIMFFTCMLLSQSIYVHWVMPIIEKIGG